MARSYFPAPLTPEALATLAMPVVALTEALDQQGRVSALRDQVSTEIDNIETQIQHNHADYLGGRSSWSYEKRIHIETLLKQLKRQRQRLQEIFGGINRRVRQLQATGSHMPDTMQTNTATRFMHAAEHLLDPVTFQMIMDLAKESGAAQE